MSEASSSRKRYAGPNVLAQTMRAAPGGIAQEIKDEMAYIFENLSDTSGYSHSLARRLRVTEVSYEPKPDAPSKKTARAVLEIEVDDEMVNDSDILHGACSAFLVDFCGSIVITLQAGITTRKYIGHVSQTISMAYHAPAKLGTKIKIVNTVMSMGKRSMVSRTEIYDTNHDRLVASGIHVKMYPQATAEFKARL
ncbi:hypothetical protein K474DRAFT_1668548 [Panus rudis PR-1116 ss-1]|nr:hypothetical protein K474DRAFT_1668548 [Panus rudis PR-1116 ss-1]